MTAQESPRDKAVGASDMDAEHELLHSLIHELQTALETDSEERVEELLRRFRDVADLHFMEEQALMRLHAYPGYAAHEQEHNELSTELSSLSQRIAARDFSDAAEAASSLENWFMKHMNTADAALEEYLEAEGIRAG